MRRIRKLGVLVALGLATLLWVGVVGDSTSGVRVGLEVQVYANKGPEATDLTQVVIDMIRSVPADGTIDVMMAYFPKPDTTDDTMDASELLAAELVAAMNRGVEVRVLASKEPTCKWLEDMRIEARRHTRIHHKVAVFPEAVLTGSANWSERSLKTDWNDIVIIYNQDVRDFYLAIFEMAWEAVGDCGN